MVLVVVVAAMTHAMFVIAVAMVLMIVVMMMFVFVMIVIIVVMMVMFMLVVVIIFVFRSRFLHEFLGPSGGVADLFEVELLSVQDILHFDLAVVRLDHLGFGLQCTHHGLHVFQVGFGQTINLIHHDRVAELNLLDEEVCDVFFFEILIEQLLSTGEFVGEASNVNNGHDVVQVAGERASVAALELGAGHANSLSDRNGFANAACFNQNVVEFAHFQQFGNLFQKVGLQTAANAAVRQRNDLSGIFLGDVSALFDERLVDVHFANVVHDDGDMVTLLVIKYKVEEGGFSGSEVTGEQRNRY